MPLDSQKKMGSELIYVLYLLYIVIRSIQDYMFLKHLLCASTAKGNKQVGQLTECDAM